MLTIPQWDETITKTGETVYEITYLQKRHNRLYIVIDGNLTPHYINLCDWRQGYKKELLKAIMWSKANTAGVALKTSDLFKVGDIAKTLTPLSKKAFKRHLAPINKADDRDLLTEIGFPRK